MRVAARTPIGNVDGFRVEAPGGPIGWVEEMWLDEDGETTAAVVRLPRSRRGLLVRDEMDEIVPEERLITLLPGARLLELDPPHLETGVDGALEASWATSGNALALPELLPAPRVVRPAGGESSFLRSMVVLCTGLFVIACALTGLCFLVPYLVAGRPF